MKSNYLIALSIISLVSLTNCGKTRASAGTDAPLTMALALNTATTKLDNLDSMLPDNDGATPAMIARSKTGVSASGAVWTTQWMSHPQCSGGGSDPHCQSGANMASLKEWMGYQLDPQATRDNGSSINIFGRINSAVQVFCAIGSLMTVDSATGYPAAGSQTITFSAANVATITTNCNMDVSDMVGQSATATTTIPDDTTYYDRKIEISMEGDDGTFPMFIRFNSASVNILSAESGTSKFSRTTLAVDLATKTVRAEYASASFDNAPGGGEFGRLFYDETNDEGAIFYSTHDYGGTPNRLVYSLRGKPSTGTEVAFSARAQGFGLTTVDAGFGWTTIFKSCINQSTGDVATDDTLSCAGGVNGTAADDAGFVSVITDVYTSTAEASFADYVSATSFSPTTTVPFTTADEVYSVSAIH